jgi:hypothetical protein
VSSLAEIVCQYGSQYLETYQDRILPSHRKVMRHIASCRTPQMGGQKYLCPGCGKIHYSYHSCRDRHCPKCQNDRVDHWLAEQFTLLLSVPYFMVTVTVPEQLRSLFRRHQKILYHLFFKVSAAAIMLLAKDKRFLGADIGLMGVLQTWTRQLIYHPHIHFLIPGGGIINNRWKYCKPDFFVHGKPLARLIRGKFRAALKKEGLTHLVPQTVWRQDWVCDVKAVGNGTAVLKYLAPYVYRIAISDRNILKLENGLVTFRYKDRQQNEYKTCTLPVFEFLRRYLQHVLPRGFVKVRYFGYLATRKREQLGVVKELIGIRLEDCSLTFPEIEKQPMICPDCGQVMVLIGEIPRFRGPP